MSSKLSGTSGKMKDNLVAKRLQKVSLDFGFF